jgi:hypothetical protein
VDGIEEASVFEEKLKDLPGPALIAVVCDSDFAQVIGYTDPVKQWEVFINEERAAEYQAPVPPLPGADDQAIHEQIEAWAMAGGSPPGDRSELRRVLSTHFLFADDGLPALTQLLGIASADVQPFGDEQ